MHEYPQSLYCFSQQGLMALTTARHPPRHTHIPGNICMYMYMYMYMYEAYHPLDHPAGKQHL